MTNYRYEIKFISYSHKYNLIKNLIKMNDYNFHKQYNDRIINNLYFDSKDFKAFNDNLSGSSVRFKTRYRWYEDKSISSDKANKGNLEFKFKKNIFGYKKIFNVDDLDISNNIDWKTIKKKINQSLSKEYKILFEKNSEQILINQYNREYFISSNRKIRVTLDSNIKIFDQMRSIDKPNFSRKSFSQDYIVVEFKTNKSDGKFLKNLKLNLPIKASRNSKYVNGIRSITGI